MRSSFGSIFLVMLTLVVGSPALADSHGGDLDCGLSIAVCLPLAEEGDVEAQFNLGKIYLYGDGVPRSDAEAARWLRLAADQGHAKAQNMLGILYQEGEGLPQDYAEAAKWYSLAAEHGNAYAQFNLGQMYEKGWGVPQDHVQAHMLFNLAFSQSQHLSLIHISEPTRPY